LTISLESPGSIKSEAKPIEPDGSEKAMMERAWAETFAREWIAHWNAHDLNRILAHYADEFEMTSPLIVERMAISSGKLKGKHAVGDYWGKGLAAMPEMRFELRDVMVGVSSIAILYENVTLSRTVLEYIEFDAQRRAVRSEALYRPSPVLPD
jgi:ketosteroid isomerase-like protein